MRSFFSNPATNVPMQSIREIFKIGYDRSSSHTMGPASAVKIFL
jgi:hypothetical protein